MADTDTTATAATAATAVAEPAAAPAAPEQNGQAAPKSMADVRSILGRGMRERAQQAAGLFPQKNQEEAPAALAPQPGNGVPSGQAADTTPAAPVAAETPPREAAPAAVRVGEAPPQPRADTAPAAPSETAEPALESPPPPPAARSERPDLPPEFVTQEYLDRYAADPLLRRELRGIWNQPGLSDVAKANAIAKRVDASDKRIAADRTVLERERALRRSGNLQEWAKQVDLREAEQAQRQQWAVGVTQMLARILGTDPNDEGFANAGAIAPGESEELRAVRFGEWAVANSPIARAHLARVTDALKAEHEAALAAERTAHEEALTSLRSQLEQEAQAQAAAALAQGRGTQTAFPPRAPGTAADGTARGPSALPKTIRDIRGDLGAGLRLRQEAARAAPQN